jgi:alpha,alpha-trehalase
MRLLNQRLQAALLLACVGYLTFWQQIGHAASDKPNPLTPAQIAELKGYIHSAWQTLTRNQTECRSFADPKLTTKPVLYVPADMPIPAAVHDLETRCGIRVAKLPRLIQKFGDVKVSEIQPAGLLYLPNPYIVPGGRFNEMYGWDSYFIIRGLVRDGELEMARNMIENFFFEIEHYGAILNANRTYYFTRSQPPFLTSMIMAYHDAQKASGKDDREWMARAYTFARRDYEIWTREPKLAGDTGLSRYFDLGEGPVPEMGDDPTYYSDVASALLARNDSVAGSYIGTGIDKKSAQVGPLFEVDVCTPQKTAGVRNCSGPNHVSLSQDYYKGDRAMRESGFDVSFRFGLYGGSTHHYAPVCLNSLLYKAEWDLAQMADMLGRAEESSKWKERAKARKAAVNRYFWNAEAGMFFDYDFMHDRQSNYHYATTFYPLWAGLATPDQARALQRNLNLFEHPGGIAMSARVTGMQWDLPYGWAPLQLILVEGLRRYGFNEDADRVSEEFVSDVYDNFKRDHTIREKYNVVTRSTEAAVSAGYKTNVVGFGWTNGVTLVLLDSMKLFLRKNEHDPCFGVFSARRFCEFGGKPSRDGLSTPPRRPSPARTS